VSAAGIARSALGGTEAWLVGGAVRDALLGRPVVDADVALRGDAGRAARALAREAGGAPFALSDAFGSWRVVARDRSWQVDLVPLQGETIEADLALRDFTINAMAEPVAGGERLDPHGGAADLEAGVVRMVSERALAGDPLRTLRAARFAGELGFEVDPGTAEAVRRHAPGLAGVAGERVFAELRRLVGAQDPVRGLRIMHALGVTAVVLPELLELQGVEQNVYHHLDVHDHTLEVLQAAVDLERDPSPVARHAGAVRALLDEPLADELTRAGALRWAALLHDVAKPATRGELPGGRVTFMGHDAQGAVVAGDVLRRLRSSEKLAAYVALLTRHHLSIGFLVHERPLSRRAAWRFLRATRPFSADVVLLTVADRLATRGRNADPAIAAHLEVADAMLEHALADVPRAPVVRGDVLARELGREPGPWLGEMLERLEEDRYAGELSTPEEAVARARALLA
jgi:putative nucleotidyltransferase with HDIG domain